MLDEYVRNKRYETQQQLIPTIVEKPQEEQKQEQVKSVTGKLKIKPIMMKVYTTNEKIDPGLNPFVGQQLISEDKQPEPLQYKPADSSPAKTAQNVEMAIESIPAIESLPALKP